MIKTATTRIVVLLILGLLSFMNLAIAQHRVSGTVTAQSDGSSLPGVNILVEGTNRGTTTNMDGNYSLTVDDPNATLVFSYIGFETQRIPIEGRNAIDVVMQERAIEAGEELVVIGYGVQEKRDLTGSIERVDAEEVTKQPALTAMSSLQGKITGVNIIKNDAPGGTPSVILRGLGTALGGRNPLYVVDGVPVDDINNISPNDIQSIDVLKDASSASIYGLRAANGVIMITTKQGSKGAPEFKIESYAGYTSVLNMVEMANAREYVTYFNEENGAVGGFQLRPASEQAYNTDWYDQLMEVGYRLNSTVSVSGGSENIDYFISYNINDEEGLLKGQKFWRQTLRNNNTYKVFGEFLSIDQNLSVSVTNETPKPFGAFNTAFRQSPLVPVYYDNGRYGQPFVNQTTGKVTYEGGPGDQIGRLNSHGNPIAAVDFSNQERNTVTLQGSISADFDFTDYLKFTSRFGATKYYQDEQNYNPQKQSWIAQDPTRTTTQFESNKEANPGATSWADNSLNVSNMETFRWNWDNFVTFDDQFDKHSVKVTAGMSSEEYGVGKRFSGLGYDVPTKEQYWNLDFASDDYTKEVNHTHYTPGTLLSYFGRLQYNYDRRYYFTGTLRRDGSSKFADNAKYWDTFPSLGVGWTISNEEFMSNSEVIDYLKLRASFGKLGNQNVPFNTTVIYTNPASGSQNYVFGPGQTLRFGASAGSPAKDISWEKIEEWNAGFDLDVLDRRLSTTFDLYQKTTTNVIMLVQPIPSSPNSENYYDHGGEVVNKGVEVGLSWEDQPSEDFSYTVGVNVSYNHNELTKVQGGYGGQTGGSLNNGKITKRVQEGQPIGAWWLFEAIGVWQSQEEIDNNPHIGGAKPGYLRYKDVNNDEVIDDRDKRFFGSYLPKYNFGINFSANYKQFDFSIDGFGVSGNKVYNGLNNTRLGGENTTKEMFDKRWTGEGSTNSNPGALRDYEPSSYYLEKGDYFRINNITLGYTLKNLVQHMTRVRFYVSAQNPVLFTGYSGFTPELIGGDNGDPYGTSGIELTAYPNTRNFLFGINVSFQ